MAIDLSGISKRELELAWAELNGKVQTQPIETRVGSAIQFSGKVPEGPIQPWMQRLGCYLQGKTLRSN